MSRYIPRRLRVLWHWLWSPHNIPARTEIADSMRRHPSGRAR